MKTAFLSLIMMVLAFTVIGQTPQAFKYQAVARDLSGNIISNQAVSIKASVLQGDATGLAVYEETHNTLTNQYGLVNLEIGNGNVISGFFAEIDWPSDIYFLQIELDETGGDNYQLMGVSQMLSIPYALEAAHASSLTLTDKDGREYELTIDENGNLAINTEWICGDTLIDQRDNQEYLTVQVDGYCWMAENINIGRMVDGGRLQSSNDTIEKYCYDNDIANCDIYGGMYQWNEMMQHTISEGTQGICPAGWHLPMDSEWTSITDYLGGANVAGGAMKEIGTSHWSSPNTGATNSSGLTILPGGLCNINGDFSNLTFYANLWSSSQTEANNSWRRYLAHSNDNIVSINPNKLNAYSVRCIKDYSTQPPAQPSDPTPADGSVDIGVDTVFSWTCSDPEGHALTYDIYLGIEPDPAVIAQGVTEAAYNPELEPNSTYYWKVVAFDVFGDSTTGNIWSFTTLPNQAPIQPSDPTPTDGSTDIGIDTVLSWTCSDPEGHALTYDIYLGNDPDPSIEAQGYTGTTYDPVLLPDSTYYWKVVAFDSFGDSAVSNIWSFTTLPNQPPAQPSNPAPADASIDISIDTVLTWTCSDPEDLALLYDIYFGTDADPAIIAEDLSSATFTPALDTNTTYFWKVIAFDSFGDSAVSNIWSFTTLPNQPPTQPSAPTPSDGSIDISIDTVLTWTCSDPEDLALLYDIYFGTDTDPAIIAEDLPSATFIPALDTNTTYFWKVIAFDSFGDSAVSNIWSFTTLPNQPPAQPSYPAPADGSIDISIDTVLSWTCSDPEGLALLYDIYFGTDADPAIIAEDLSNATYTPALDTNTTYFWKVIAFDSFGDSAVSNIWSFTTLPNQPPAQPSDPAPADGSIDISFDTVLSWTCSDPEGFNLIYDIYLGNDLYPDVAAQGLTAPTFDPALLSDSTYYWKVVAFDVVGDSTISDTWTFTTLPE